MGFFVYYSGRYLRFKQKNDITFQVLNMRNFSDHIELIYLIAFSIASRSFLNSITSMLLSHFSSKGISVSLTQ